MLITLNKYRKANQLLQEAERSMAVSSPDVSRLAIPGAGANVKNNRSMSVTREVTRVVRV